MLYLSGARLIMVLLLIGLGLSACARLAELHIAADEDEGGIIGTGILGTITDIGSIHVNGVWVTYDDDLKVETAFGDISPTLLRPGDTVAIEAFPEKDVFKATSIQRYRPIVAPVQAIDADRRWFQALGMRVQIDETSALLQNEQPVHWRSLKEGHWVAVDGIWREDQIIASNVRLIKSRSLAAIRGVVGFGPDQSLYVGRVRIEGIKPSSLDTGNICSYSAFWPRAGVMNRRKRRFAPRRLGGSRCTWSSR